MPDYFRQGSPARQKFFLWLFLYSLLSLLGQFGCMTPVDLSFLLGEGWWIPLGTLTIVPLVDVSRSFAQHYAELYGLRSRQLFCLLMGCSFFISLVFALAGSLPIGICLGTFAAVNLGGFMDLLVFRRVRFISAKPYVRMLFSNLVATMTGGAVFYWIAYSNVLDRVSMWLGLTYQNPLFMDHLFHGWLVQTMVIWSSSVIIAIVLGKWLEQKEGRACMATV